jgi:hypothetical protein
MSEKVELSLKLVEALLASVATSNWSAVVNVANDIRRAAEDAHPDRFRTGRHGR